MKKNGQSAAKFRIGKGSTTIPRAGVGHKLSVSEVVGAYDIGEDMVCAVSKDIDATDELLDGCSEPVFFGFISRNEGDNLCQRE